MDRRGFMEASLAAAWVGAGLAVAAATAAVEPDAQTAPQVFPAALARTEEAGPLAHRILKAAARSVGLVHLPRCGDGRLGLALVKADPHLVVHAQDANAAAVAQARNVADSAGVLNRRISIDQGDLFRLLPVGRSCDLVMLEGLRRADMTDALAGEIARVLHPWYGLAVVGFENGAPDAAARAWTDRIGQTGTSPELPRMLLVRAKPLAGADNWTHWWHGPDNNAVSTDTAYGLPEAIQWTGKPFFSTRLELPIVSGGRLFVLWNGPKMEFSPAPVLAGHEGDGPLLTAHAAGSGVRLWAKRLSPAAWLQISRSSMVADGDTLLLAEGNKILELDASSGTELRQVVVDCGEIKWMALHQGRVFILGGPAMETTNGRNEKSRYVVPYRSSGLHLVALDRKALKPAWRIERQAGKDAFDPRSPAIDGDRLFLCTEEGRAEAYATEDGRLLWKTSAGFDRMEIQSFEWDRSSRHPVTGYAVLGVYVISGTEMKEAVVLAQEDGRRLWTKPTPGPYQMIPLAFGGLIWPDKFGEGVGPLTGKGEKRLQRFDAGGCARFTASPQGIVGTCGLTYDLVAGKSHPILSAKSACGTGQYVANGLIWKFPSPCPNCTEWRGFIVRAQAEKPPAAPQRLVAAAVMPQSGPAATGWTSYRADMKRSASSTARIGSAARIAWQTAPVHASGPSSRSDTVLLEAEFAPVPPVVCGMTVVIGGADGAVEALDLAGGRRKWRALTGGRIYSSPTIWRDRVLVGSGDGFLYALSLADGRELWRLRIAPQAGRIMVFGQLGSRWPVLCSPLVADDRVYVTAGLLGPVDGVVAVGAEAATGRLLWERNDWQDSEVAERISGAGQLCWNDAIVYHGGESPLVRISPNDGSAYAQYARGRVNTLTGWASATVIRCTKGQDVGTLSPGLMVFGGRRMLTDQAEHGVWRNGLAFLSLDAKGQGRFPVCWAADSTRMPAWDDGQVLLASAGKREGSIALVSQARLQAFLRSAMAGPASTAPPAGDLPPADAGQDSVAGAAGETALRTITLSEIDGADWRQTCSASVIACVLTEDAALTVELGRKDSPTLLVSRRRTDGMRLWAIPLPAPAVHDGLAVAADGSVVLTLMDGQTLCIRSGKDNP